MTLLYMDSYDYLPAAGSGLFSGTMASFNYFGLAGLGLTSVAGAFGGLGLGVVSGNGWVGDLITPQWSAGISDETIIGQRMSWTGSPRGGFWVTNTATGVQFYFIATGFGELLLYNSDNTILARTAPGSFDLGKWNYFEFRFNQTTSNTGRVRVRINTALVIDYSGSLGSGGLGKWNTLRWGGDAGIACGVTWDDLYVLTTGSGPNNDYLGNVRVRMQQPSAPGDVTGMSPTGAPTNWQAQINPAISSSIYVSTPTVGNYDLYDLTANSSARAIYGVQSRGMFMQDDATQLTGQLILKTESVEYPGTPFLTSSSLRDYYSIWDVNPHTGVAWTNTEVNAAQIGPKLYASA